MLRKNAAEVNAQKHAMVNAQKKLLSRWVHRNMVR
jgi:hypothetical protein